MNYGKVKKKTWKNLAGWLVMAEVEDIKKKEIMSITYTMAENGKLFDDTNGFGKFFYWLKWAKQSKALTSKRKRHRDSIRFDFRRYTKNKKKKISMIEILGERFFFSAVNASDIDTEVTNNDELLHQIEKVFVQMMTYRVALCSPCCRN